MISVVVQLKPSYDASMSEKLNFSDGDIPEVSHRPQESRTPRRARRLAHELVEDFAAKIYALELRAGDKLPTESAIMQTYGVSRTVVREAISRLQAAGLVDTQHGVGTFVLDARPETSFRINPSDIATAVDVLAVLELRISLETEAAGLAAQRRTDEQVEKMRKMLDTFTTNIDTGGDTVTPDIQFHSLVAQATGNRYFVDVMSHLGATLLPRTRVSTAKLSASELTPYLRRVNQEHEQIFEAIARRDTEGARAAMRLHLGNGRERQRRALEAAKNALLSKS